MAVTEYQDLNINLIERQYGYKNVSALMVNLGKVWDKYVGQVDKVLIEQFFDIDNCVSEALDNYWGKLLNISRVFEDSEHNIYTLTDDEFREVIKIKLFNWDGSLIALNDFFRNIFAGRGKFFGVDSQDMTWLKLIIGFNLTENEQALFTKFDIFPRPAGIGWRVQIIPVEQKYFGFVGYQQYTESPVTVGFGTYNNGEPTGDGKTADYDDNI